MARVKAALRRANPHSVGPGRDYSTRLFHMTPDCMTLDELESCIHGLQDGLDVLRAEARRTSAARGRREGHEVPSAGRRNTGSA
jgi:hypothetical protein